METQVPSRVSLCITMGPHQNICVEKTIADIEFCHMTSSANHRCHSVVIKLRGRIPDLGSVLI